MVFCWSIWLARNYLTHGNIVREPQDVITRVENVVASLRAGITQGQVDTRSKTNNPSQTWQSPPQPWYKVNVDAGVSSKADHAGIRVLVRNSAGDVMAASIYQVPFLGDVVFEGNTSRRSNMMSRWLVAGSCEQGYPARAK